MCKKKHLFADFICLGYNVKTKLSAVSSYQGLVEFLVVVDGLFENVRGGQAVAEEGVQQWGVRGRDRQRLVPVPSVLVEKMLPRFGSSKCVSRVIKPKKN